MKQACSPVVTAAAQRLPPHVPWASGRGPGYPDPWLLTPRCSGPTPTSQKWPSVITHHWSCINKTDVCCIILSQ